MEEISLFQKIYEFIIQHQPLSYWIVFLSTLLEATVFIGLIIPAGLLLVVFGFIAYSGYLTWSYVLIAAIIGAIIGDILNYFLGQYHDRKNEIKDIEKIGIFLKKKNYLDHGKEFFVKHGGKGVLFGRFIGMVRPFIAFIAGGSGMRFSKFIRFSTAGAIMWILFYFEIGYLFGSSIEIFISWFKKIEDVLLVVIFVSILFLYLRNIFRQKIKPKVLEKSNKLLEKIEDK